MTCSDYYEKCYKLAISDRGENHGSMLLNLCKIIKDYGGNMLF
ncbi:hypothetical protein OZD66_01545 [Wolbachia endosymbiont of Drosophila baimaii]|nr:hypothetical protein [Wolbachia endosymbiont of Drosophila baimaii]